MDHAAAKITAVKGGKNVPFIHTRVNRPISQEAEKAMAKRLGDVLSVPADGVYVEYEETEHWGWQGENF